ncbi:glycosyl transferase family 2 domain-containing protein [Phthorimaea operculella]|nr:glycosyl transferase family 2 domain-containing protein [Phthorimaea operculella]
MLFKYNFCLSICRGRKKKIISLTIVFTILLNAMFYVSLELYNTVKKNGKHSWFRSIHSKRDPEEYKGAMKIIVGHYVGGSTGGKLSEEDIHTNNYSPVKGAGEWGRPVQMSQREIVRAKDLCREVKYELDNLPTATVVIVFHNEAWSTLMRTVMSVLLRSPDRLLKEIILVDDASERRYLGKELDDAIANLDKVRILRSAERKGLVAARLMGAREATGDVLVFLDAHCEATPGWLEPLLDRAGSDDVFICPHIDILNEDTLAYSKSIDAHWGAFSWRLHFRWIMPSKEVLEQKAQDPSKPYPTPAMAGGLFAVRKSLFWRLGGYDEGMKIWGGENLELSWRAWQCGARVEITSCSRVGHIFRTHSPYAYPGGVSNVLNTNLARAATVWMDEWAEFYFKFNPAVAAIRDLQTVGDRDALRRNLKCKSFKWYLENVWPNHYFPNDERWFGRIKNDKGACVGANFETAGLGGLAAGVYCGNDLDLDRLVIYTPEGRIMADEGLCLEQGNGRAIWKSCKDSDKQIWLQKGPRLKSIEGLCLTLVASNDTSLGVGDPMTSKVCKENDTGQIWHFERVPWR